MDYKLILQDFKSLGFKLGDFLKFIDIEPFAIKGIKGYPLEPYSFAKTQVSFTANGAKVNISEVRKDILRKLGLNESITPEELVKISRLVAQTRKPSALTKLSNNFYNAYLTWLEKEDKSYLDHRLQKVKKKYDNETCERKNIERKLQTELTPRKRDSLNLRLRDLKGTLKKGLNQRINDFYFEEFRKKTVEELNFAAVYDKDFPLTDSFDILLNQQLVHYYCARNIQRAMANNLFEDNTKPIKYLQAFITANSDSISEDNIFTVTYPAPNNTTKTKEIDITDIVNSASDKKEKTQEKTYVKTEKDA